MNFCLKFNALMTHSKRFNGPSFDSVSSYYMSWCKCSKAENDYWALKCFEGQCKKCSSKKIPEITNLKDEVLCYNEFLVKSVPFMSKKMKEMKGSKQTVRETEKRC